MSITPKKIQELEAQTTRFVAWSDELRRTHQHLREAARATRDTAASDETARDASRELLMLCHGFCVALNAHHAGEDRSLFPAIERAHPELAPTLRALERDHSMIAHLLAELEAAVTRSASPRELRGHLEGVSAIMENHFRYEERQLLTVLNGLELNANVEDALGPL
jgi:hemerythrin-like domain-containing protein